MRRDGLASLQALQLGLHVAAATRELLDRVLQLQLPLLRLGAPTCQEEQEGGGGGRWRGKVAEEGR